MPNAKIGVRFQIRLSDFGQAVPRRFASPRNWNLTPIFALGIVTVFAALGPVYPTPNAMNRFTYSKREVLIAT